MTHESKRERLEEIKTRMDRFGGIAYSNDVNWMIAEIGAAWSREAQMHEALRLIYKSDDLSICPEIAYDALFEVKKMRSE